jgi:hypothetical protein
MHISSDNKTFTHREIKPETRRGKNKIYAPSGKGRRPGFLLLSGATEVVYEGEKYCIVPQSAILMPEREESL